ncbi:MAG: DUF1643 domain-containing protein [Salinirussus sp.]
MSDADHPHDDRRGAVLSEDREYRYQLSRRWDTTAPTAAFVMLNPSTADETDDDPTIRRCLGYAREWGCGTLLVGNLFAFRTSDPADLSAHPAPVGPENDAWLARIADRADRVVAAWGTKGTLLDRDVAVREHLDCQFYALDTTKDGHPNHPLYQPSGIEPEPYVGPNDTGTGTDD